MTPTSPPPAGHRAPGPLPDVAYARMTLVLRVGLLTAVAILLVALGAFLLEHPGESSNAAIATNPLVEYLSLPTLASGLTSGAPEAYLALGTFVLIATPLVRVATGSYYFAEGRERVMTAVTLTVLVLLVLGILVIGPLIH
ncbi:MAG TPA: DUF1634 domain-containing protein [Thermoplasmata archaeon]|nr:DUF1634 domain-containing protein [Thermoplasmata archaeon]